MRGTARLARPSALGGILLLLAKPLAGQSPPALERERAEFAQWLATAALSPYAAIAVQPVGSGITIGQEPADIPLPITSRGIARPAGGGVVLEEGNRRLTLPRGHPVPLQGFQLIASGSRGHEMVTAYGPVRRFQAPAYFPYAPDLARTVTLEPPERRGTFRTLGLDGTETDAVEAGLIELTIGSAASRLRVYRVGSEDDEEAELLVFFRDSTNGHGSYPAGRFLELVPAGTGTYRLDFNRSRNPFCAYNPAFACPAPWPGNSIAARIAAGETYQSSPH